MEVSHQAGYYSHVETLFSMMFLVGFSYHLRKRPNIIKTLEIEYLGKFMLPKKLQLAPICQKRLNNLFFTQMHTLDEFICVKKLFICVLFVLAFPVISFLNLVL